MGINNIIAKDFNSQPHKEADLSLNYINTPETYFNSQPHKEADKTTYSSLLFSVISTHSLTRRLTDQNHTTLGASLISTHSLTRRLTKCTQ